MFDNSWKEYRNTKMIKEINNLSIIIQKNYKKPIPIFCQICEFPMRNPFDSEYWKKCGCCADCGMKWADKNFAEWQSGWRPTKEEILEEKNIRSQRKQEIEIDRY